MAVVQSLDSQVRERLRQWPQRPPGLSGPLEGADSWLRGRPGDAARICHPFLKLPGSDRLRTLPDGLWLNFGGTPVEPFVDILAIEACASLQNLLDKRSRFAPSTHSMLAVCPVAWLLQPVMKGHATPRWRACGVLRERPTQALSLPVRDMRVLYGLRSKHYESFAQSQIPHPHEYFAPMEALTAWDGHEKPEMRELVSRASATANFMKFPRAAKEVAPSLTPAGPPSVRPDAAR
jgi:hypothetical protein